MEGLEPPMFIYQLTRLVQSPLCHIGIFVIQVGFEPTTYDFEDRCSNPIELLNQYVGDIRFELMTYSTSKNCSPAELISKIRVPRGIQTPVRRVAAAYLIARP
jgi:hypothetical protein